MNLVSPTFLFRFAVPCAHYEPLWPDERIELPEAYRLPSFGELESRTLFADLRMGWNANGFSISLRVAGKRQSVWCRTASPEESDGLALFFDTRFSGAIHRASRYCHHFMLLPQGAGKDRQQPLVRLVPIARAQEDARPIADNLCKIRSEKRVDGYLLRAALPTSAFTGLDLTEQRQLGFSYAVMDRELGWQTFSVHAEFPFMSDPSLWGVLELRPPEAGSRKATPLLD